MSRSALAPSIHGARNQGADMPTRTRKPSANFEVAHERSHFHSLLAANPNYFGTLPALGFPTQLEKQGDTTFEAWSTIPAWR